jgi:pyridoxal phosphate enzyme (YggS family)
MAVSSPAFDPASISARFAEVRARIATAATRAGRDPGEVTLVAVSKTQSDEAIDAALATGQRVFGENRVQEAQGRWTDRQVTAADLELRLIGPLQTNKARDAVALFDVIETLDREKLAGALAEAMRREGRSPRLLVQVNTGDEDQKAGVAVPHLEPLLDVARETHGLTIDGLMCIPPVDETPNRHFTLLSELAKRHGLATLSMGMSGDYETAIAHGATHVRVGSALFGERKAPLASSKG